MYRQAFTQFPVGVDSPATHQLYVPGVGSHSYVRCFAPDPEPEEEEAPTFGPKYVDCPPIEQACCDGATRMKVTVVHFEPDGTVREDVPPPTFYTSPEDPTGAIPHSFPLTELPKPKTANLGKKLYDEWKDHTEAYYRAQGKEDPMTAPLTQNGVPLGDGMAIDGIRPVILGRYDPKFKKGQPIAIGEMARLPAGYMPGPPGYGYENYSRPPPPERPGQNRLFPDSPVGVPLSHGHPSFIGRSWEESATARVTREASQVFNRRRGSRASVASMAEAPAAGEDLLNPHSTIADREYQARVVFRQFDEDENDVLDLDEFRKAMNFLGVKMSRDDAKTVYELFDEDGSGTMDEEEFVRNYLNNYS